VVNVAVVLRCIVFLGSPAILLPAGFLYATERGMSVEYLFAASFHIADEAARNEGWEPRGRTWHKPDGTSVCFICFEEQLAVTGQHVTIYFVGKLSPNFKRFKRNWVKLLA
jgi:hypothetical protein